MVVKRARSRLAAIGILVGAVILGAGVPAGALAQDSTTTASTTTASGALATSATFATTPAPPLALASAALALPASATRSVAGVTTPERARPLPATAPVKLDAQRVTDRVGALSAIDLATANARLAEVYSRKGIDLYAVFVDEFTSPSDRVKWANATADLNGLGKKQYLLAVSTVGRQYFIASMDGGPLSDSKLDGIEDAIKPSLEKSDWLGALTVAAGEIDGNKTGTNGTSDGDKGGGWIVPLALLAVAVVAVIVFLVARAMKRRRARAAVQASLDQLEREAGSALVQTDDAVKTSADELEFARAQFGDDAVGEYAQALAAAQSALGEAFSLRQKLDDEIPDTEQQIREWLARIVELCAAANAGLDEKARTFDELRKLEQNAPEALARVQQLRIHVGEGSAPAREILTRLQQRYAPSALQTVAGNPAEEEARLRFADEQLSQAQIAVCQGESGPAAVGIRAAEQAVAQAAQLQQAVAAVETELQTAAEQTRALVQELHGDIAAAQGLPDPDGRVAQAIASTEADIATAESTAGSDPLRARETLTNANTRIDGVVAAARDAAEEAARAARLLDSTLSQAQSMAFQAESYITSRRGAVGATARTRLAEAQASLDRANALRTAQDPRGALSEAQRALQLAQAAIQAAQNDVSGFDSPEQGSSGDLTAAIIGGLLINGLGGGGRRSWGGGSSWGGSGGRSSGGFSPGSFGGGGTRSRRGGGRF